MEPHYLAARENWQQGAMEGGGQAEQDLSSTIKNYLDAKEPGVWLVESQPKDLKQIYLEHDFKQSPNSYLRPETPVDGDVWYDEQKGFVTVTGKNNVREANRGCIPDCKVQHVASGRRCFIECKNQGDAGNAHERAAKYATPSMIAFVQKKLGIEYLPFAYVFTGNMVESPKYILELQLIFGFAEKNLFLWKKGRAAAPLIEWLETAILPPLRA
jgi:hypothetical protein